MTIWMQKAFVGATMSIIAAAVTAQNYPARPITVVVPVTAGTASDTVARLVMPEMAKRIGQSFVVENRTGASSNIGVESVVRSKPDGYTVLLASAVVGIAPALSPDLKWNPLKDLVSISMVAETPLAITINASVPANNLAEFIALTRRQPDAINYASPGNGTPPHVAMELFKLVAKAPMTHVPYKGTAGTVIDLVAGRVDASIFSYPSIRGFVKDKKVRVLAWHSEERLPWAPDTPTLRELGFGAAEVVPVWLGLFAPAGTPQGVLDVLSKALQESLNEPHIRTTLLDGGIVPVWKSGKDMESILVRDVARWTRVVKEARIKAE